MDMIGIDLHKRESQLCTLADGRRRPRAAHRDEPRAIHGRVRDPAPARILLEASTESEWVAQCLEALGHEVIVADPNFAPMYATRSRRVKTDRRDARTLAEALKLGAYRPAHRVSPAQRHARAELAVREALVRTRTRYIAIAKAFVRRDGLRVPSSESHVVAQRVAALPIPAILDAELAPLFAVLEPLNAQIAAADRRLAAFEKTDPIVALLATAPSVGPLTASAFVSTLDDVTRFPRRIRSKRFSGLSPASTARARNVGSAASRRPGTRARGTSWSRRPGASCAPSRPRPQRCGHGGQDRRPSWQPHRRRRAGAAPRRDSVRDVARQRAVQRRETSRAAGAHRTRGLVARAQRPVSDRDD